MAAGKKARSKEWYLLSPKEWETLINFVYDSIIMSGKKLNQSSYFTSNNRTYSSTYGVSTKNNTKLVFPHSENTYSEPAKSNFTKNDPKTLPKTELMTPKYLNGSGS
jgi:hypothetical protein